MTETTEQPFFVGASVRFVMPDDNIEFPEHQGELGIVDLIIPGNGENDPGLIGATMLETHQYLWHSGEYWVLIV
jgi:hypothetical protein